MTFKSTQSPGAQSIFCGISCGKKSLNNKIFEETGKLDIYSLAFTSDSTLSEKNPKPVHSTFERLQQSFKGINK